MSHEQFQYCGKPLANYREFDDIEDGEGEHLCWARSITRLESDSIMLGQIALIVRRYCRTPETTTLEAVQAMDARIKKLNARIRKIRSI